MKKQGFTLVELLAVILILGLLMAVAVPASVSISNNIKKKMLGNKMELATQAAKLWSQDNTNCFTTGTCSVANFSSTCTTSGNYRNCYITLIQLADADYLDYDQKAEGTKPNAMINPTDKSDISAARICISYNQVNKAVTAKYNSLNLFNCS